MANADTLKGKLTDLASTVRGKTGSAASLTIDGMTSAIAGLEVGGESRVIEITNKDKYVGYYKDTTTGEYGTMYSANGRWYGGVMRATTSRGDGYYPYVFGSSLNRHSEIFAVTTTDTYDFTQVALDSHAFESCVNILAVHFPLDAYPQPASQPVSLKYYSGQAEYAFASCVMLKYADIAWGGNCHCVPDFCFSECYNLTTVCWSPGSMAWIGMYAFANTMLATLIMSSVSSIPSIGENAFMGTNIQRGRGLIMVPSTMVASFKANSYWKSYSNMIVSYSR